jgi:hypothetical protein
MSVLSAAERDFIAPLTAHRDSTIASHATIPGLAAPRQPRPPVPALPEGETAVRQAVVEKSKGVALLHDQLVKTTLVPEETFWAMHADDADREATAPQRLPIARASRPLVIQPSMASLRLQPGTKDWVFECSEEVQSELFAEYPALTALFERLARARRGRDDSSGTKERRMRPARFFHYLFLAFALNFESDATAETRSARHTALGGADTTSAAGASNSFLAQYRAREPEERARMRTKHFKLHEATFKRLLHDMADYSSLPPPPHPGPGGSNKVQGWGLAHHRPRADAIIDAEGGEGFTLFPACSGTAVPAIGAFRAGAEYLAQPGSGVLPLPSGSARGAGPRDHWFPEARPAARSVEAQINRHAAVVLDQPVSARLPSAVLPRSPLLAADDAAAAKAARDRAAICLSAFPRHVAVALMPLFIAAGPAAGAVPSSLGAVHPTATAASLLCNPPSDLQLSQSLFPDAAGAQPVMLRVRDPRPAIVPTVPFSGMAEPRPALTAASLLHPPSSAASATASEAADVAATSEAFVSCQARRFATNVSHCLAIHRVMHSVTSDDDCVSGPFTGAYADADGRLRHVSAGVASFVGDTRVQLLYYAKVTQDLLRAFYALPLPTPRAAGKTDATQEALAARRQRVVQGIQLMHTTLRKHPQRELTGAFLHLERQLERAVERFTKQTNTAQR